VIFYNGDFVTRDSRIGPGMQSHYTVIVVTKTAMNSVARLYIFRQKIPNLVHLGRPRDDNFGVFHGHLEFLLPFGNIVWPFRIFEAISIYFFLFLVCCTKKNLATLSTTKWLLIWLTKIDTK
jgi:hypothetical protein